MKKTHEENEIQMKNKSREDSWHLEFYSRTLILSHQTLGPLHFASRYSMTQMLKDKQLTKGKKREGENVKLKSREPWFQHNTLQHTFPSLPLASGWFQRNEQALAPPHPFAKEDATKVSLIFMSSILSQTRITPLSTPNASSHAPEIKKEYQGERT